MVGSSDSAERKQYIRASKHRRGFQDVERGAAGPRTGISSWSWVRLKHPKIKCRKGNQVNHQSVKKEKSRQTMRTLTLHLMERKGKGRICSRELSKKRRRRKAKSEKSPLSFVELTKPTEATSDGLMSI